MATEALIVRITKSMILNMQDKRVLFFGKNNFNYTHHLTFQIWNKLQICFWNKYSTQELWLDFIHITAMVKTVDDSTGEILQALRDTGMYDNSVIIFTADVRTILDILRSERNCQSVDNLFDTVLELKFWTILWLKLRWSFL